VIGVSLVNDEILKVVNVDAGYVVKYKSKRIKFIHAVNNVSLELRLNRVLGIAGESGCGKTTLAKIIYGITEPPLEIKQGAILLKISNGYIDLLKVDRAYLSKEIWWKVISYIPQNSMNVLNPMKRIRDSFVETLKFHGLEVDKKEVIKYIRDTFNAFGIPIDAVNAYPHQLSGGMRQRVVIALALMLNPKIVIADEPTTAVDVVTQLGILTSLKEWQKDRKSSMIIVSHDMGVHAYMDEEVAIMYAGNIVEKGDAEDIFRDPLHPYTKILISSLIKRGEKSVKKGITGSPPDLSNPPPGCRFHPRCPFAMDICRRGRPPTIKMDKDRTVSCWLYIKR
jgi:peptide/nickel transport system ATP-binding protein